MKKAVEQGADQMHYAEQDGFSAKQNQEEQNRLVGLVNLKFAEAKMARQGQESRWLQAYHNFRGIYPKNVRFRDSEKSRVFVKITKTKVVAAYGQLIEVVFGADTFPIGVKPTKVPEGVPEYAHLKLDQEPSVDPLEEMEPEGNIYDIGYKGDGRVLRAGKTLVDSPSIYDKAEDAGLLLEGGPTQNPQEAQISPAKLAAEKMEKLIHDQIEESDGANELRRSLFESVLLGTGVIKGPFNFNKTIHRWEQDEEGERTYAPIQTRVPRCEFVSVWDFFPDPTATSVEDSEYLVHRHKYNASQVRALRSMPAFDAKAIARCVAKGPNYTLDSYENELKDGLGTQELDQTKYEVLEYWGIIDEDTGKELGLDVEKDGEIQVNAWVCNNEVLRVIANPFLPTHLPYHAFSYEQNPYSLFGIGVGENMDDSQQIMNGHARMAIDNMALSGSLIFDVDTTMLEHGQSLDLYPGKVFRRQSGQVGQAIHGIKFPNTTQENLMMFDKFRQLADEQTGIPSYSHGITGVQSMTRTASGMSMLLGAASLNIKTVVKNLDDMLLKPLGKAYYRWNMQFFEGPLDIQGDLDIRATGTSSLMQKEVRSQRLTSVLQTIQNPALAPYVRVGTLLSELAKSLDLDPDEIMNSPEEAEIAAKIIGMQNVANGQVPSEETGAPSEQGGTLPPTQGATAGPASQGEQGNGNGTIGTGNVPVAGEAGFSAPTA